jgi:hypothetical protein
VDGRVSEGTLPSVGFDMPKPNNVDLRLNGIACRIDNLELNSLISSQVLSLAGVQLIAAGVSAELEATQQEVCIYDWKLDPPA